jgi:hypothetical protein
MTPELTAALAAASDRYGVTNQDLVARVRAAGLDRQGMSARRAWLVAVAASLAVLDSAVLERLADS